MTKDLIIIGAGPGGYEAAIKAGKSGLSVLLVDKGELGGTCLNWGCIPTKALYRSAELVNEIKHSSTLGVSIKNFEIDFDTMQERKNNVKQTLIDGIAFMLKKAKVEFINGLATFINNNTIVVNDTEYTAKNIMIATGSTDAILPIDGIDLEGVIGSKELLEIKSVPNKLTIIGGGVIGLEMASIFNALGSNVTVLEFMENLLPMLDSDLGKRFKPLAKKAGIAIETKAKVTKISKTNSGLTVTYIQKNSENEIDSDIVLVATGRKVFYDQLGLDNTDIVYSEKGIKVDEKFETSVPNIYAVGDVLGKIMLAHTATYQSFHVIDTILNIPNNTDFTINPSCVFTFPEIATVGLTEEVAKLKFDDNIETSKYYYKGNGKALAMNEIEGFIKIVSANNIVVGVHILGYSASTLIHEAAIIIKNKMTKREAANVIHAHPTLSEVLMEALRE